MLSAPDDSEPLTPALSPAYRGEGVRGASCRTVNDALVLRHFETRHRRRRRRGRAGAPEPRAAPGGPGDPGTHGAAGPVPSPAAGAAGAAVYVAQVPHD